MPPLSEVKQRHRAACASGGYRRIARGVQSIADHVVRGAGIRPGELVLDIACGTGDTALMARARGALVTGLDLSSELLAIAEQRAEEERYGGISWKAGDPEMLPFPDGSFDVVVSSCGLMFAPGQQKVAREVARVTRRGGRIAIPAWTREGGVGRMFHLTETYLPPTTGIPSPFAWGDEARVKTLFGAWFRDYRFERYDCPDDADTPEQMAALYLDAYGPTHRTYHALSPERAAALRTDLIGLYRDYVAPGDGEVRWGREYRITLATRV